MLELNVGKGGMKRLMEEPAARHAETVHYSASAGIRVGGEESRKAKDSRFWPSVLKGLTGVRLKKEEADRAERLVQEVTGWSDPVDEKTGVTIFCAYRSKGGGTTGVLDQGVRRVGDQRTAFAGKDGRQS
jgi:hypothetical protein